MDDARAASKAKLRRFAALAATVLHLGACNGSGATRDSSDGSSPEAGTANGAGSIAGAAATDANGAAAAQMPSLNGLLKATYHVAVKIDGHDGLFGVYSLIHQAPCSGDITLAINASSLAGLDPTKLLSLTGSLPIECGSLGTLDVSKALGGLLKGGTATSGLPVVKAGDALALTTFSGITFTPPRPIFPSLLASTKDRLTALNVMQPTVATYATGSSSGTYGISMASYDQPYTPPGMKQTFPHAMHFIDTASGFDGLDAASSLTFQQLEFRMSTDPIAVLQIVVKSSADKLLPAISNVPSSALTGFLASTSSAVAGAEKNPGFIKDILNSNAQDFDLTITIDLTGQDGLNAASAANRGEVVDGQATGS